MGFENSEKFGTENFNEEQAYNLINNYNKLLWEKGETEEKVVKEAQQSKKSGFCQ